jgi:hypothetical protein
MPSAPRSVDGRGEENFGTFYNSLVVARWPLPRDLFASMAATCCEKGAAVQAAAVRVLMATMMIPGMNIWCRSSSWCAAWAVGTKLAISCPPGSVFGLFMLKQFMETSPVRDEAAASTAPPSGRSSARDHPLAMPIISPCSAPFLSHCRPSSGS